MIVDAWPGAGQYRVIYADPPWHFSAWKKDSQSSRLASSHYNTMSLSDIQALPVSEWADPAGSILLMWAVYPLLPQALATMSTWGYRYTTVAFTWAKRSRANRAWHVGLGYYTRANAEICLLGRSVLGKSVPTRRSKGVSQLVVAPVREHSRKPDCVPGRIEALFDGPYLELFARSTRPGWASWGNQTDHFSGNAGGVPPVPPAGQMALWPEETKG